MKHRIVMFCLIGIASLCAENSDAYNPYDLNNKFMLLQHETLHRLDGAFGFFDGTTIENIRVIMNHLKMRLLGVKRNDGLREGIYEWKGKRYSLSDLAALEAANYFTEEEHRELVEYVKAEFCNFIKLFMARLTIAKSFVIALMKESCVRRGCPDSFMLNWSKTNDDELGLFKAHMKNFDEIAVFFKQLYYFLGDLAYSCPKGREQAMRLRAENKV